MSSNNPAQFNFYLNRQGAQGKQGEKGDQGFSPSITEGKNTLSEYTLLITNQTGTFETANLREHKEDRQGTYMRYDRDKGVEYAGAADIATEDNAGVVRLSGQNDFDNLGDETVLTPYRMATANPLHLALADGRDDTLSGTVASTTFETDVQTSESGGVTSTTIASDIYRYVELWQNGVLFDIDKDYYLRQMLVRSTDGSVTITNWQKKGIDLSVNFPPAYTLPIATSTTLGGIKIGEGLEISEDGTVTVTGGGGSSYVLPPATATALGGIKAETKTDAETNEVKIDPATNKLYVAGGGTIPTNLVTTDTEQTITGRKMFINSLITQGGKIYDDNNNLFIRTDQDDGDKRAWYIGCNDSANFQDVYIRRGRGQNTYTNIDSGNISSYAASSQDVEELSTELNQLASDVTNIENQISSIDTSIEAKQDALGFKEPLVLDSNTANVCFDAVGSNIKSKYAAQEQSMIPAGSMGSSTDSGIILPSDSSFQVIDWTKIPYYFTDQPFDKTYKIAYNSAASPNMYPSLLFGKKEGNNFYLKFVFGYWLNSNNDMTFVGVSYPTYPETGRTQATGYNTNAMNIAFTNRTIGNYVTSPAQTYSVKVTDAGYGSYQFAYTPDGGAEQVITQNLGDMSDVNCVIFSAGLNEVPLDKYGVFDGAGTTRLWNPLVKTTYSNDVTLNYSSDFTVQDGRLSLSSGLSTVARTGSYNDLTDKPTIPEPYTLPVATNQTLGGIKVDGTTITITEDGTISSNQPSTSGVQADGKNTWTGTNLYPEQSNITFAYSGLNDMQTGYAGTLSGLTIKQASQRHITITDSWKKYSAGIIEDYGTREVILATTTDLSFKADRNLSNSVPSQSFKDMSINWGLPDYNSGIQISSGHTAEYNCFITSLAAGRTLIAEININGKTISNIGLSSQADGDGVRVTAYASKGDVITGNGTLTIYPLKGAK